MNVEILKHTPDPEETIALAARLCYSASDIAGLRDGLDRGQIDALIGKLLKSGHATPFEHASFTFGIDGVSRAATHQLVRHRIASYSQQSQRYVAMHEQEFVLPPRIRDNQAAREKALAHYAAGLDLYRDLLELGIEKEDARYVLSEASCSKIIVTMNVRELFHFFRLRCCNRAQWEIRGVAIAMLKCAREISPGLFASCGPACLRGACPEGEFSCGKSKEVKQFFQTEL